ncbi:MAG TPA: hypothetical protein VMN39_08075 [Longimicrobiaceae bacterium]|nr:hypothetical protein [Longimicrobiaceae bacterium]
MPGESRHLTALTLEQLAEENRPAAEMESARAHLEACGRCTAELETYQLLFARLGELPRYAPSLAFADSVMARVQLAPREHPAMAWLRRLVPTTRRGWVLVGSAVLAPALPILGLVLLLLTQPLVSPAMLWQWALLRTQSMSQAGFAWLLDRAINSGLYGSLESGFTAALSLPMTVLGSAAALVAIAIPLSGWGLLRLTRTPMGSVNHANS